MTDSPSPSDRPKRHKSLAFALVRPVLFPLGTIVLAVGGILSGLFGKMPSGALSTVAVSRRLSSLMMKFGVGDAKAIKAMATKGDSKAEIARVVKVSRVTVYAVLKGVKR